MPQNLKTYLDQCVSQFNQPGFIENDPISIPHRFKKLQDIEIMAFWTSILAWGRRQTIINKAEELVRLMGGDPYQFILTHQPKDRQAFEQFKHRTFLPTDTIYFLEWLQQYYRENESLETAFAKFISPEDVTIEKGLVGFRKLFFSLPESPKRTRKHIASPQKNSTCKRLNMFLRWMVRNDDAGVDFGLWKQITPSQLCIPFDVHVERVARSLGLVTRKQRDWKTVLELTQKLREFDPNDPVKYDFALFGLGVLEQAGPPLK